MNTQKLVEALDATISALTDIKKSLQDTKTGMDKVLEQCEKELKEINSLDDCFHKGIYVVDGKPVEQSYTELLANRLAWSYSTMHPEYRVESQFRNLGDMISNSKISYVLNWVKRKGVDGLEDFFRLPIEDQRKELQIAIRNYETQIKDVFAKRFSQQ